MGSVSLAKFSSLVLSCEKYFIGDNHPGQIGTGFTFIISSSSSKRTHFLISK
jgi:hypothetical protein